MKFNENPAIGSRGISWGRKDMSWLTQGIDQGVLC